MVDEKQIRWVGSAYDDLLAFPRDARKEAGFQLGMVQAGLEPTDWKPFDDAGAYVAKFEEAIYVLHCFQKRPR
jgi:phage-related protein